MSVSIRGATVDDAAELGRICYQAFAKLATTHGFTPDFPDPQIATNAISAMLGHERFYGVVAERGDRTVGSNFLDQRAAIAGIGPITVDPGAQNAGIGRLLMEALMRRAEQAKAVGMRLVQAAYHCRSLSLYSKLGFDVREHLSCVQGPPMEMHMAGRAVRAAGSRDVAVCSDLALRVHGHHRQRELEDAVAQGSATVVERAGRITGYASAIAFLGHAVAESNEDLQALIAASRSFDGPGFLVPSRNGELLRWCLNNGLHITQPMTLMTRGLYSHPVGAYLPSVIY
jgi:GNAT superfamily N-acetyltransferase